MFGAEMLMRGLTGIAVHSPHEKHSNLRSGIFIKPVDDDEVTALLLDRGPPCDPTYKRLLRREAQLINGDGVFFFLLLGGFWHGLRSLELKCSLQGGKRYELHCCTSRLNSYRREDFFLFAAVQLISVRLQQSTIPDFSNLFDDLISISVDLFLYRYRLFVLLLLVHDKGYNLKSTCCFESQELRSRHKLMLCRPYFVHDQESSGKQVNVTSENRK
ncbi:hypothetical protein EDC96DRAFT_568364 [Choanephora cucurbitarum]|nr:hypothetical protein EDC96DRAFT_568364 [Choanephora cucurbitarum]